MNPLKILPLLFLMILLGCIQQPVKKTEGEALAPTYGLAVDISGGNITITRGSSFSLMVSIKNNGDFDANLKKIWLLGDILYIDGNITETPEITIHKKEVYVKTFSPLTVSTTIGKDYFEFYPAICYEYKSEGIASFYITTNDQVFVSNKDKPLKKSSSNSPLFVDFQGLPIYKLTEVGENNFSGAIYFSMKIQGKNPNSWPVASCDDLSNVSVKNVTLKVIVPPGLKLDTDDEHWTLKRENYEKECIKSRETYYEECLSECNASCCENSTILQCIEDSVKECWKQHKNNEPSLSNCLDEHIFGECIRENCLDEFGKNQVEQSMEGLEQCLWNYCINISENDREYCENIENLGKYIDACARDITETYKGACMRKCKSKCKTEVRPRECSKEYLFQLDNSYYSYLRSKQALRDIPFSFKLSSNSPIDLEEIVMILNVTYDFYEIFPEKKSIFKIA